MLPRCPLRQADLGAVLLRTAFWTALGRGFILSVIGTARKAHRVPWTALPDQCLHATDKECGSVRRRPEGEPMRRRDLIAAFVAYRLHGLSQLARQPVLPTTRF